VSELLDIAVAATRRAVELGATGAEKLGHPVLESNFVPEENNGVPQHTQEYRPARFSSQWGPVKARSVPCLRVIRYCSGVSCPRHSSSVFFTLASVICEEFIAGPSSLDELTKSMQNLAINKSRSLKQGSRVPRCAADVSVPSALAWWVHGR